jgi:hypothetical protein
VEEKRKPKAFTLSLLAKTIFVGSLFFPGFGHLPLWNCGACGNRITAGHEHCRYCSGTGKQDLFDRMEYFRIANGGGGHRAEKLTGGEALQK